MKKEEGGILIWELSGLEKSSSSPRAFYLLLVDGGIKQQKKKQSIKTRWKILELSDAFIFTSSAACPGKKATTKLCTRSQ